MPATRLSYRRHDLRQRLSDTGFDAALNVFSSLGYGTEADAIRPRVAWHDGAFCTKSCHDAYHD